MNYKLKCILIVLCISVWAKRSDAQDWTHYVRTAGHGLEINRIHHIMEDAEETFLYGIEVDNDIPGRYESFLDPTIKLKAIKAMADSAHAHDNHAFVYIAGLECITANADSVAHSFFKDHPDWMQRNKKGEPAIFGSGDAFWIHKGDEDVWISPYAPQWRKIYMERIRQIAATGIEGIYIDIPYWMTHFTGWEDTWASFDQYTVAAFKEETGINALTDFKLGDWSDPDFIAWVDFRINSITDFISEVDKNIKSIAPECKLILEIYPGLSEAVPRVGADNYQLSQVADVITHEYNPGNNSAQRAPLQWMQYMIAMYTFRAFAAEKPTWMLSYSWGGEKKIQPADAMKNLFVSQVMAGTNSWDAARFVMSGSNDYDTRRRVYKWIDRFEKLIYAPRKSMSPIGVYFSPKTRNYFSEEWKQSFFGIMEFLLKNQLEFEIVTPRTLSDVQSKLLILPDVKCLSDKELVQIKSLLQEGKALIFTAETGYYNDKRKRIKDTNRVKDLADANSNAFYFKNKPGAGFYTFMDKNYNEAMYKNEVLSDNNKFYNFYGAIQKYYSPAISLEHANGCVSQFATVSGKPTVFIANFSGLKGKENAIPFPKKNVTLTFNDLSKEKYNITFIPFLGEPVSLKGKWNDDRLIVTLPTFLRGAIVTLK